MDGKQCLQTYFIVNKVFLFSCGTWPYQHTIFAKTFRYFWITQQIVIMAAKSIKLYEIKNDTDLVIEAVASFFYNISITIKFVNQVINEHKVKIILEKIQDDWKSLEDDSEIKILSYYARLGKLFNFMYIGAVYSALISYMVLPLTPIILDFIVPLNESRPKQPLIMAEFFIDQDKYFYPLMIHAYLSVLYGIIPLLGTDTLYMNCVHHSCGMLKILGNRIRNILNSSSRELSNKIKYEKMVKCIIQHQNIIEFCNNINETYSTSFLIVLCFSITLMSFSGVATVIKLGDNFNDVIRFGFFSVAQIFHLLCYNYMGQNVLNYGEELRAQIYNTNWYEASLKTQRLVKFMMAKNMHPIILRANIVPLCLPNFTRVIKTSMSYFTVLQSTR
ncbi:odorant receptor 203 [Nasonia vitripennis]|uniref:Odorant receptor n=1 Tax=Nasonia vitripennis TaxID=7425 RepID=A0A7M6UW91_NASVI|nr:odorant receptor 203 [Nasonia vitripennis]